MAELVNWKEREVMRAISARKEPRPFVGADSDELEILLQGLLKKGYIGRSWWSGYTLTKKGVQANEASLQ